MEVTVCRPRTKLSQVDAVVENEALARIDSLFSMKFASRLRYSQQPVVLINVVDCLRRQFDNVSKIADTANARRPNNRTCDSRGRKTIGVQQVRSRAFDECRQFDPQSLEWITLAALIVCWPG